MKTGVIGYAGNMGRRYTAILDSLGEQWEGFEVDDPVDPAINTFIVATPTDTHLDVIEKLGWFNKPVKILLEKPVHKVTGIYPMYELKPLRRSISRGNQIYMVNQYAYYPGITEHTGDTIYDYYNTGSDGLAWDCIQLIHLAGSTITLGSKSPVWFCCINGVPLDRETLDRCYVSMVADFLGPGKNLWGWNDIRNSHEKAYRWKKNSDRRAGKKQLNKA